MKVYFDTNVYIGQALTRGAAEAMVAATRKARWRAYVTEYVLDEIERIMVEMLDRSPRYARSIREQCKRSATSVSAPASRHTVPEDPDDSPILQAAIAAGIDYLVTNDAHLLALDPYERLRIVTMTQYHDLLEAEGLL